MSQITKLSEINFNKIKVIENLACLESYPPFWSFDIVQQDNTRISVCLSDKEYLLFSNECRSRNIANITNIW